MAFELAFIIGAPRSGTTLLERMLSAHSAIRGGPEPHLMTPLAHLGVWRNVDKAPYDHIVAGIGQRDFVAELEHGEDDYWRACRAYALSLYGSYMAKHPEQVFIDKTPEYATVWPFLKKVFPEAKYIVLTRHPAAIFSSFANSFFDGDFKVTEQHDPLFERYIPAMAGLLRDPDLKVLHIRYEDLVSNPEHYAEEICRFLGVQFEAAMVDYGKKVSASDGLGDPINVGKFSRPTDQGANRWAIELAEDAEKYRHLREMLARVSEEDIRQIGFDPATVWQPVEELLAAGNLVDGQSKHSASWTRYKVQRKLIVGLRGLAQSSGCFRSLLKQVRLSCEVILREY